MDFLQNFIHRLEVGGGMRFFRYGLAVLAVLLLVVGYNARAYRNLGTQEAMDAAQVGRNLAEGKGFSTLFVRPFSIYLLKRCNPQVAPELGQPADPARLRGRHPDLANAPAYPLLLAALMKVLPFHYTVDTTHPFWSVPGRGTRMFYRYEPDFIIALFNELIFLAIVVLVFLLARRLFDPGVAWLSGLLLLGSELLWRFSVSGLSTMLLLLIFTGLIWCLTLLEEETREPKWGQGGIFALAALAGVLVGVGGLTRYAFGWLILPVLLFLILFTGKQRAALGLTAFFAFMAVMTPWVARNISLSNTPFGTATYAVLENTFLFPENRLQRSLEPDLGHLVLTAFWQKFFVNARQLVQNDLPRLGGSWVSAFFLVGLMMSFRKPTLQRLRYFLLACLPVLFVAQAMGRTQLSEESPDINSENLLVLLAPVVLVYGISFFYTLLDQVHLPFRELRYGVIGGFVAVTCLPLILVFLPPKTSPIAYPPYLPSAIQTVANWMKEDELIMSDIPWAMAWYGHRQSVWLTLRVLPDPRDPNSHEDFFAISDYQKPIPALYLTPATMDSRFLTQWIQAGELSWGSFIVQCLATKEIPPTFPLRRIPGGWLPSQLILLDWERWRKSAP